MSKFTNDIKKLKEQIKAETHNHLFFLPKSKAEEKKFLKKHENDNITIEMLKIYDW